MTSSSGLSSPESVNSPCTVLEQISCTSANHERLYCAGSNQVSRLGLRNLDLSTSSTTRRTSHWST